MAMAGPAGCRSLCPGYPWHTALSQLTQALASRASYMYLAPGWAHVARKSLGISAKRPEKSQSRFCWAREACGCQGPPCSAGQTAQTTQRNHRQSFLGNLLSTHCRLVTLAFRTG